MVRGVKGGATEMTKESAREVGRTETDIRKLIACVKDDQQGP